MNNVPSRGDHPEMDLRASLANEFFEATGAEVVPFVSDEANWYDFDYLETTALVHLVKSHYGIKLTETELNWPFWRLLDYLDTNRT
jgi:hypothetical protein